MRYQFVGRGAQRGVAGGGAVLRAVDVCLQVLYARAYGKGLARQLKAAAIQQFEDVACGVAAGKDKVRARDALLVLTVVRNVDSFNLAA